MGRNTAKTTAQGVDLPLGKVNHDGGQNHHQHGAGQHAQAFGPAF